jgi:hypothetical protein
LRSGAPLRSRHGRWFPRSCHGPPRRRPQRSSVPEARNRHRDASPAPAFMFPTRCSQPRDRRFGMAKTHSRERSFIRQHSLSIASASILILWILSVQCLQPQHPYWFILSQCNRRLVGRRGHGICDQVLVRKRIGGESTSTAKPLESCLGATARPPLSAFFSSSRESAGLRPILRWTLRPNGGRSSETSFQNGRRSSASYC